MTLKDIKVLGPGCANCVKLLERAQQAADELQWKSEVQKVTDLMQISSYGVMMTPALVIDGQIVVSGKVPSVDEIKALLAQKA
ncbi:MAG: TM0996/MTH895 family glutaredoxin-like protein [candidate division Zixibacteria bacterium]|nr:TM0996/MTH895 family glutaredoxin-like protein [candidate division Zixibacteria bacterium]